MGGLFSKPKAPAIPKAPEAPATPKAPEAPATPKAPEVVPVAPEPAAQKEIKSAQMAAERERRRRMRAYGRQQTVAGGLTGTSSTMQAGSKSKMGE